MDSVKRHLVRMFSVLLITCAISFTANAAFENNSFSTRGAGMGSAFTAVVDDVSALTWNPSGLMGISSFALAVEGADLMGVGLQYFSIAGAMPLGRNKLGMFFSQVEDSVLHYNEEMVTVGWAGSLKALDIGMSANLYKIDSVETASGYGFNLAASYKKGLGDKELCFGFLANDLISSLSYSTGTEQKKPIMFTIGAALKISGKLILAAEIKGEEFNIGYEYLVADNLACRVGLNDGNVTCGLGISMNGLKIDYAYLMQNLGNENRFSISKYF